MLTNNILLLLFENILNIKNTNISAFKVINILVFIFIVNNKFSSSNKNVTII